MPSCSLSKVGMVIPKDPELWDPQPTEIRAEKKGAPACMAQGLYFALGTVSVFVFLKLVQVFWIQFTGTLSFRDVY